MPESQGTKASFHLPSKELIGSSAEGRASVRLWTCLHYAHPLDRQDKSTCQSLDITSICSWCAKHLKIQCKLCCIQDWFCTFDLAIKQTSFF